MRLIHNRRCRRRLGRLRQHGADESTEQNESYISHQQDRHFMSNSPNHNCAHLAVILSEAKDLAHEAWRTREEKRDPTPYERFLAPLGMTLTI